jgi:hypothetical protein
MNKGIGRMGVGNGKTIFILRLRKVVLKVKRYHLASPV